MVIAIGANGDGVLHWCHYVHHHWSQWIAIGTIFCRHWRQWREPQIVMTLLPKILLYLNFHNHVRFSALSHMSDHFTE